jgi:hypothetical protein
MQTAQGAVERLTNAAKETFLVTLGQAITNGAGYKSGVDAMTGALQGMTTWVNENRDGISGLVRDLASLTAALITAFGWVSKIASVSFRNSSFGMLASMLGGGRAPDVPTAMTEGANPFAGTTSFGGELATGFGGFALHTLGGGTMARGSGTLAPMTHTPTAAEKAAAERAERTAFQNEQFERAQRLMAGVTNISGGGFTSLAAPLQIAPQRMPRLDIPVSALGQQLGRMGERVDRAFGSFGTDAASAFAKSLTAGFTAIANGPITFGNFFRSMGGALLGGLGSIFTQVGEMLVEYGIAMTNLLPFLTNIFTSGPAALVAGGLLIALGSAFGGAFTGGGRGRGGGGGGGGSFSGGGAGGDVFRGIVLSPRAAPVGGQFAPTGRTGTPATAQPIVNNFTVIGRRRPDGAAKIANMVASASRRGIA